jgi:hypothetical protein
MTKDRQRLCPSPSVRHGRLSYEKAAQGAASGFNTLPSIRGWRLARMLSAQGIEAEIPQADRREAEELKRKARPRIAGLRPKTKTA